MVHVPALLDKRVLGICGSNSKINCVQIALRQESIVNRFCLNGCYDLETLGSGCFSFILWGSLSAVLSIYNI